MSKYGWFQCTRCGELVRGNVTSEAGKLQAVHVQECLLRGMEIKCPVEECPHSRMEKSNLMELYNHVRWVSHYYPCPWLTL